MKINIRLCLLILVTGCAPAFKTGELSDTSTQEIPGRLECEYYDTGGEGLAYHDSDSVNNGSGRLNPVNGNLLHEFRINEGVDISYTKTKLIDNNPFNKVTPDSNKLYVGWTMPGEWIKYTIHVKQTGSYQLSVMYTANGDGVISLDLDGKSIATRLTLTSTHDDQDTVAWRQWHHWNRVDSLATMNIEKGIHTLKLNIVEQGQMSLDYFGFTKIN
jgi:hypothetical protein